MHKPFDTLVLSWSHSNFGQASLRNVDGNGMLHHAFFNMRDCFILLPVITVFAHFVSAPALKSLPVVGTSEARDSKRAGFFKLCVCVRACVSEREGERKTGAHSHLREMFFFKNCQLAFF